MSDDKMADRQHDAKCWVWTQMSTADKLAASNKILDEQGYTGDRGKLGIFTWGPANPGHLPDPARDVLYKWVSDTWEADSKLAATVGQTRTLDQHAVTMAGELRISSDDAGELIASALQAANELKLAKLDLFMEREGLGPEDMEDDL